MSPTDAQFPLLPPPDEAARLRDHIIAVIRDLLDSAPRQPGPSELLDKIQAQLGCEDVGPDNLARHIAKLHSGPPAPPNTQPHGLKRRPSGSSGSFVRRCACGQPAMQGDDYCYSCRPD